MSRKTQRYSKEFKAEAVRTVLENQLSISEGASRLSLPEGTLGQWVTAARKGLGTPGSRTVAELESEILQLRKALNEARLERDMNRPGFPGECFICELRLPDHRFRWKHNKLFLLLPEEYGPAFPAIVDCYTSPPT